MWRLIFLSGILATIVQAAIITSPRHGTQDWYETAIFYQIYPRSFKDSDGDGIGDIQGIISKLEHLKEIGVGGTWLSPIFESPMKDFGYDISNFYAIQKEYGTMEDAVLLFQKAKELDIKIILDFVPNHSSDQCEWFIKSAANDSVYRDYYVWHEGIVVDGVPRPPNNWNSVFYGSAWTWHDQRKAFYLHQFDKSQPDLNFRHQPVVDEMKNVLRFWMDKGASGFRVDAVNHLFEVEDFRDEPIDNEGDPLDYGYTKKDYTKDLDEVYDMIYQWREVMDQYQAEHGGETRIMMSEAYANETFTMKYYQSPDGSRQGSHMPFNFVLINELYEGSPASDFKKVIDARINALPSGRKTNWVIGNHDQARVGSRYGPEKIDALLTLVMTLPGIAVTYNGEEIGMVDYRYGILFNETVDPQACNAYPDGPVDDGWIWKSRDPVRTPFQWDDSENAGFCECGTNRTWLPVNSNYKKLNLELQKSWRKSTFNYYKELSELRQDDTMKEGGYESFVVNEVFAFTRTVEGHDPRLVLINLGDTEQVIDVTKLTHIFSDKLRVLVAGSETSHEKGDILNANDVYLRKYNAIVVESFSEIPSESSAESLTLSLSLLIVALPV
ncbi:Maltase 2 [Pseudolycoriella hygida]|uniref:alpha-glucosidase n=1 Tax=Pseudolycoriella hygida TaxID=35572 RepID=A0A9Q0NHZ3_9DIPT|nr:Maltase 2 [Pseudolycoriella hygida]